MRSTGMATASTGFGLSRRRNEMQKAIAIDFDGCLWNKLFKKDLFNSYHNIEDVFKTALKKAVRISLFV